MHARQNPITGDISYRAFEIDPRKDGNHFPNARDHAGRSDIAGRITFHQYQIGA